jgi:hypothetical protein
MQGVIDIIVKIIACPPQCNVIATYKNISRAEEKQKERKR